MVVDADILVRMPIAAYLRECGYRVIEAANTEEAMIVLREAELKIDAILTDIESETPGGGFALAKWVRENRPHISTYKCHHGGNATACCEGSRGTLFRGPTPRQALRPCDRGSIYTPAFECAAEARSRIDVAIHARPLPAVKCGGRIPTEFSSAAGSRRWRHRV